MDDSDDERAVVDPFDEELTSAIRPATDGHSPQPGEELTSAIRPTADGHSPDIAGIEIDVEELTGPQQTLEPTIRIVWILQSSISAAVLGVITGVAFALLPFGEAWFGGVVFTLAFALGVVFAVIRYRVWCYEVREDSLSLRRGVLTRVSTVVPHVRIQHVDVRRGPIERTFGLATTVVYTAGSRGADVSIPGLSPERARNLQTRLKQLAIAAEGEDAV